jgi:hypothetical protein
MNSTDRAGPGASATILGQNERVTAIAALPGRMSADSLDTGSVRRYGPKIFRRHDYLVGTAGSSGLLQRILSAPDWPVTLTEPGLATWINKFEGVNDDSHGTELILATRDLVWVIEGDAVYSSTDACAVGCGAAYALGYLEARPGKLKEAVECACRFDPYCGGPVTEVRLPPARAGKKPRPSSRR